MVTYPVPPNTSLLKLALKRGPGLKAGQTIPRIEVAAERLVGDAERYQSICSFAEKMPITWPALLSQPLQVALMTQPAFPLSLLGIVHVSQRIIRHRLITPDEVLSASCHVEGHRVVKSGGEFDLVTTVRAGTEPVYEGITTILSRQIKGDGESRPRQDPPAIRPTRSTVWKLPADQGWKYAEVSGDYNPIHLSPWSSRLFGFKRPIVHGWWTLGRALAELDWDLPAQVHIEARFLSPISLPGEVVFESEAHAGAGRFGVSNLRGPCLVGSFGPP